MSVFELSFALSAVILGLAIAHIAGVLHRLLLAGRRVSWSPETILLTAIVLLVIIAVWLFSWNSRNETSLSVARTVLEVLKLIALYIAAASCLPEPGHGSARIDTYEYYDRTRRVSFGALVLSYMLFQLSGLLDGDPPPQMTVESLREWFMYPVLYGLLIVFRARWLNILILSFALAYYAWRVGGARVGAS